MAEQNLYCCPEPDTDRLPCRRGSRKCPHKVRGKVPCMLFKGHSASGNFAQYLGHKVPAHLELQNEGD